MSAGRRSPIRVLPVSDDVRRHHPGAHHAGCRRAHAVSIPAYFSPLVESDRVLPYGAHGLDGRWFPAAIGSGVFTGENAVRISSFVTAPVLCIPLGKRHDCGRANHKIHSIPMAAMGVFILLFCWFGFNAGSALAADGLAARAFAATAVLGAELMLSWMLRYVIVDKKLTRNGASTGVAVGLVGITPGAGFVPIWAPTITALTASPICFFMIPVVKKIGLRRCPRRLQLPRHRRDLGPHLHWTVRGGLH